MSPNRLESPSTSRNNSTPSSLSGLRSIQDHHSITLRTASSQRKAASFDAFATHHAPQYNRHNHRNGEYDHDDVMSTQTIICIRWWNIFRKCRDSLDLHQVQNSCCC
mmetsp:Transcript_16385/g.32041  ORF Transcript_16385/g.32041 Transcript_16385/m.32041 type:complete len:107 (+) Transcript_16385:172-492(+)